MSWNDGPPASIMVETPRRHTNTASRAHYQIPSGGKAVEQARRFKIKEAIKDRIVLTDRYRLGIINRNFPKRYMGHRSAYSSF